MSPKDKQQIKLHFSVSLNLPFQNTNTTLAVPRRRAQKPVKQNYTAGVSPFLTAKTSTEESRLGLILCKNSLQKWAQEVVITRGLKSAGDGSKEVRGGGEGGGGGGGTSSEHDE